MKRIKHISDVEQYSNESGVVFEIEENSEMKVKTDEYGSVVVKCNKEGLLTLSKLLLHMGLANTKDNIHVHLAEWNGMSEGSVELIVERCDD